jgi:hypothetical protein
MKISFPDKTTFMKERIHETSIDLEKEIMFRIEGEAGRFNTKTTEIVEIHMNKSAMLSYSPDTIVSSQRIYSLYSTLPSKLSQEDKYVMIENEMLGIVATGKTEEEAEQNFAHEFDFIYQRYNQLTDDQMTERIKRIKTLLNTIVKEVTEI